MKITFLLPHLRISGGVKALLEYANRLRQRGHKVTLAVPAEVSGWRRLARFFPPPRGSRLPAEAIDWFDNKADILRAPFWHHRYLDNADILVASSWQTAQAAAGFPASQGAQFYFVQHHEALWARAKEREQAAATYRLPLRKVAISTWLRDILREQYGQDALVLVTPVAREMFLRGSKQESHPPRVCLLHHDYDWKGYADGIEAVRRARAAGAALELTVFGEKTADPKPLLAAAGFAFEYRYRPTGEALRRLYAECDIYLCPSWHEGLGMPAMEAMANRCALVTADTGGSRDYAVDGETALVSPPRDAGRLAANLALAARDRELRRRLAESGFAKIGEFDWDVNCARLERAFAAALPVR